MHILHYCSWISMSLWKDVYVCVCFGICMCVQKLCVAYPWRKTYKQKTLRGLDLTAHVFSYLFFPCVYFTRAAGHLQLGELCCFTTAVWAQCAYLALFPTWWDRSEVMRDCSWLSPLWLTGAIISANLRRCLTLIVPTKGVKEEQMYKLSDHKERHSMKSQTGW